MNGIRLRKVISNMEKYGMGQIIITSPESIYYLLGEWIHPGERMLALYIDDGGHTKLFLNELFPINKDLGLEICSYNDAEDPIQYFSRVVDDKKVMGVDKEWPSHFLIRLLKDKPGLKVEIGSTAVDTARMIKDEDEIVVLRKASEINDMAMEDIIEAIFDNGLTELEAGKTLGDIYSNYGSDKFSFEPLICYGAKCAEPHHSSDNTKLLKNSSIIIDIGCKIDGYCSDMTRSLYFGEPDEEYTKIYGLVLQANLAGIAAVKPGVRLCDIDMAARKVIEDGGYGKYFTHRTGHNIGIREHEYPDVSSVNTMVAEEGMVFSIEPGIYLAGKYGVRIEDLVLVTKDGCDVLNGYPKELVKL